MSTVTEEGLMDLKIEACEQLLAQRVEVKIKTKKADGILNRIHVATPAQRDTKVRAPCIPEAVLNRRKAMEVEGNYDGKNVACLCTEIRPKYF